MELNRWIFPLEFGSVGGDMSVIQAYDLTLLKITSSDGIEAKRKTKTDFVLISEVSAQTPYS